MIIGISGKLESGKDTLAEMMVANTQVPFEIKRFAYKLKYIASYLSGVAMDTFETQEGKQTFLKDWNMTAREFLIKFGTNAVRDNFDADTWVKALFADYKPHMNWIIPDVRFPNEKEAIRKLDGMLIRVNRPGLIGITHESETALDADDDWDFVIQNDKTLEALNRQAKIIIAVIGAEI